MWAEWEQVASSPLPLTALLKTLEASDADTEATQAAARVRAEDAVTAAEAAAAAAAVEETVAKAKVLHARLQTDAAQAEQSLAVAVAKIASTESEASQVKEALQAMRADRDSQAATLATTTEDLKQSQRLALNLEKRCGAFFSEMAAANDRLLNSATDEEKLREHAKTLLAQTQALQKQLDDVVADRDRLVLKMAKVQSTHDSLTSNAVELQDQLTKALDDIMTMSGEYQQASINP
jgi:chromosome segregation ATPase